MSRQSTHILAILLFLTIQAIAQVQPPLIPSTHINASAQLQHILTEDAAARKANDSNTRVRTALGLEAILNHSAASCLATAHAWSVVKDSASAFGSLREYARLDFTNKAIINNEDKKFAWLTESKTFDSIRQQLKENAKPISHATKIIDIPDTGYLVEDIDYDKTNKSFLFTSVLKHAVYRLGWDGKCSLFATSIKGWPVMAIKIDNKKGLVWFTEMLIPGFDNQPDTIKGQSAVTCFNLNSGKLLYSLDAPDGAQWADMTLDKKGNPIVCDGQSGAIFRLSQGVWQRIDQGDFISPQTPALTEDGKSLIVPDYERGLAILNIESGDVSWIKYNNNHPCPLTGTDGVYANNNNIFLTQNGTDPERVQQLEIKSEKVINNTIIEKGTPTLGDPTHGVLIDGTFYFIANSGWDVLDAHGKLNPGARMTPPAIMKYPSMP